MEAYNINSYKHIFFIGIGGVSQSSLAKLCLSLGKKVSGSDKNNSLTIKELKSLGITIYLKHSSSNINEDVDLIVYTSAISSDNPEIIFAKKNNIPHLSRAEFLGIISKDYKHIIAVSGIHGKTTTTGMISSIFLEANLNPTIHIGGHLQNINGTLKIGGNEFFITEACEYQQSFLNLNAECGIILNVEMEHTDYYKNFTSLQNAFNSFAKNSKKVFIGEQFKSLINHNNFTTISLNGNSDFKAINIKRIKNYLSFDVIKGKNFYNNFKIYTFGLHNVYNALVSIAVADYYNIDKNSIAKGLKNFQGIKRRFEFKGKFNKALVFEDYAHHPTEIMATLSTCKETFNLPIICFFQPHTYSRTKNLFSQFLRAFTNSDYLYILPTYSAREKPHLGYNSKKLQKSLEISHKNCYYLQGKNIAKKTLKSFYSKKCVIMIIGAGDIYKIIEK